MIWNSEAQAILTARSGIEVRWLVWFTVKALADNAPITFGLSTDSDDRTLTVEGQSRFYYGRQGAIALEPLRYATGTEIASWGMEIGVSSEAETILRGYNTRLAAAQVHAMILHPDTLAPVDIKMAFDGMIDGAPIITPEINGVASAKLKLVSAARRGTLTRNGRKSDETQKARSSDRFRKYGSVAAAVDVAWGSKA